ncbi:non-ribosomal peptide synthetase, partial [Massilia sp. BJB1822]|uniref:non-ribosomal peptide synthetase n=1 Tax=Massilia sp. BJB1822 TaxID=2744470 RepID=UPI0015947051
LQPESDPERAGQRPDHLAYVIYTSGSTGRPKGVMIAHVNAVNLICWGGEWFDRYLQQTLASTSINFDLAVFELFVPLSFGKSVRVVRNIVNAATGLSGVTLLNTVPSAMRAVLSSGRLPESVQMVNLAGEPLKESLVSDIFSGSQVEVVANLYGPTETTTYSSWITFERQRGFLPVIGRPIANTQIYILDRHGVPAPLGVAGEIHIGGIGVARGYLKRLELTAERFITDPFSAAPGARLYKTGDLGRWLADGNVEYLGRNDFQVKVRGFRIELGEIEAALAACAGVGEAMVIAREDQPGDQRLVAYFTAQEGAVLEPGALRAALAAQLPEYMVPAAFVTLEAFPMTPNGKLDRKALPAPEQGALASRTYTAPQGEVEAALAAIWQELLGVERVGRDDHFFELGGHSLLAVQLVSRIRQALGVELPLRILFIHATLAALAVAASQAQGAILTPIKPIARDGALPLSWAQQRLWFIDQLGQETGSAYHMPAALRLSGELDEGALQATLDRIVARHEALRTTFVNLDGIPQQHIGAADCGFALRHVDLRGIPDQEARVVHLAGEEAQAPFDLASGPLIRGQLLRLAETEYVLLLTQHHIISDGWSIAVLVQEVSTLYRAFHLRQVDPLPALAVQYADYAAWQRARLQGEELQRQIAFWTAQLGGAPALLELPTDRPRPAVQSHRGASHEFMLSADMTARLEALGQRHGATLFMTLLAGWAVLLSRLSGQDDVVIGTPVANRSCLEVEPLIGFFVNTLALRLRLDRELSVAQVLAMVKSTAEAAFEYQELPFEYLVEELQPQRSLSYNPLFQVSFTMHHAVPGGVLDLPGLRLEYLDKQHTAAQFDLSLSVGKGEQGLFCQLIYSSELFDAASIVSLGEQYAALLVAMTVDDSQAVQRIAFLPPKQEAQLLALSQTAGAPSNLGLVHRHFEALAARQPDATALKQGDTAVSYAMLNRWANQLANYLQQYGIQVEDRVAIYMERGIDSVVAMLAVLKTGGAYVPLDNHASSQRISEVLADCIPVVLLTQPRMRETLPDDVQAPIVVVDSGAFDDGAVLAQQNDANLPLAAIEANHRLAYVMHTSGSTGRPKGVMIEHGNILHLALNRQFAPLDQADCIAHCANPAFDAATWEVWGGLLSGAAVLVVPQEAVLDARQLTAALIKGQATALWLTVGLFNDYVDHMEAAFARLRWLLIGGDALNAMLVRRALEKPCRPQHLVNGYGPTECTTFSTTYQMDDLAAFEHSVPIGRPIAGTRAYILDKFQQQVVPGAVGELYIGGAGVARGYLGRAEWTAERFIADPFSAEPDARLYKTGDLARYLADGNIEYLGRNDFQVKLRGFRIEPGEIEARLMDVSGVREAVVLAREDQPGDKRLVAYLTAEEGATLTPAALRAALANALADYMVPSAFVVLAALPLTPNGKLDRRALPAPEQGALASRTYAAPQGEVEAALAAIWQELLGVERVGRDDHFFELGGHSLLAVQLVSRVRQTLDAELPLRALFAQPTLAALASAVAQAQQAALPAIDRADRSGALPLSWSQQRLWFLAQLDAAAGQAYH